MTHQGEKRNRTFENVKEFWDKTADEFKLDPHGTIRDHQFRLLEIDEIRKLLKGKKNVLDIGCGNGYSTIIYAQDVDYITGADYAEDFVKYAEKLKGDFPDKEVVIKDNIDFEVADIKDMPFEDNTFDAVVCERVLINLPTWELQQKAIEEVHRVLKPEGVFICMEVTLQGHENVNKYRNMFGLEDLERYWHNNYLDETKFINYLSEYFGISTIKRLGMYQFISKVVHPLLVAPEEPKFDAKINEVARKIAEKIHEFKDCTHQVMFVATKR